ncbi:hypothetical protein Tco_0985173 [Tanacetum coccineum]
MRVLPAERLCWMNNHHLPCSTSDLPYEPPTDSFSDQPSENYLGENFGDHSSNDISLSGNEDDHDSPQLSMSCYLLCQQGGRLQKENHQLQKDPLFDVMPEDNIDHMETDNAQSEGRTREMVDEDKEIDQDRLSTEDEVSTVKEKVSTDFEKVSTDKPKVSTDGSKVSADDQVEGTEQKNEGSEKIFESTEEPREGTEEKVESTAGPFERKRRLIEEDELKVKMMYSASCEEISNSFESDEARIEAVDFLCEASRARRSSTIEERAIVHNDTIVLREASCSQRSEAIYEDKEVDYEVLDKNYPIIDWKTKNLGTEPQFDESKGLEEINLNVVTRSNGQKRYFSTLMRVLSVFDRED